MFLFMKSSNGDVIPKTEGLFSFGDTSFHFDREGRL